LALRQGKVFMDTVMSSDILARETDGFL
jgi:hypothetical protein